MPSILIWPVVGYVLLLSSVRTRRGATNVAIAVVVLMLVAASLVLLARWRQSSPYRAAFQWINIPVAFSGDQRFLGFGIDLSFRLDHAALIALIVTLLLLIACLIWHRVAGRGEQGPVRLHVNMMLLALGSAGVMISGDLAELLAFWLLSGLATYLLLGHRWGTDAAGWRSRVALAVPFVGDVVLLCGVALLYSRFGTLTLDNLFPALTTTLGVGIKSLTVAALLILAAAAIRAAVWPFTLWQTATVDAPAASVAAVAGVWPVLAGSLLLRTLPLMGAAGGQLTLVAGWTFGIGAVAGPLLGLTGVDLRRSVLLASSGAIALSLLGLLYKPSTGVAFMALLAVAAARTGAHLAGTSVAAAMRTVDMRATGGGWQRMPATSATLLVAAAVLSLAGLGPAMLRPSDATQIAYAAGLGVVALSIFRPYFAVAHGPLRRRRAFEPERVREAPSGPTFAGYLCEAVGALALVAGFLTGWISFLGAGGHAVSVMGTNVLWLIAPVAGAGAAMVAFGTRKDQSLAAANRSGELLGAVWERAGDLYDRLIGRPGRRAVRALNDVGLPAAETGVGEAFTVAGGLAEPAERGRSWLPATLAVAVALVTAFALIGQGLGR